MSHKLANIRLKCCMEVFAIEDKIYRGTHQIGGCITEITTEKTRIIIDFGTVLPYRNGKMPKENLVIEGRDLYRTPEL